MTTIKMPKPKPPPPATLVVEGTPAATEVIKAGLSAPRPPAPPPPPNVATTLPPPEIPEAPPVPPPVVHTPENFDEYIAAALKARTGNQNFMNFWATMAQADAMDRIASSLERLIDGGENEDGEETLPLLTTAIADGIEMAAHDIKDALGLKKS